METKRYIIKSPFSEPTLIERVFRLFKPKVDQNPFAEFTNDGITIENPETNTIIAFPWTSCKGLYVTAFYYTTNTGYEAMYVAFFIELKAETTLPEIDILSKTTHGEIPFVFTPKKFASNMGITDKYGFYLNGAETPDETPENFLKDTTVSWGRIRPFVPVNTPAEYNAFIVSNVSDEATIKEYSLPETT